jgi:hypothetical protein
MVPGGTHLTDSGPHIQFGTPHSIARVHFGGARSPSPKQVGTYHILHKQAFRVGQKNGDQRRRLGNVFPESTLLRDTQPIVMKRVRALQLLNF